MGKKILLKKVGNEIFGLVKLEGEEIPFSHGEEKGEVLVGEGVRILSSRGIKPLKVKFSGKEGFSKGVRKACQRLKLLREEKKGELMQIWVMGKKIGKVLPFSGEEVILGVGEIKNSSFPDLDLERRLKDFSLESFQEGLVIDGEAVFQGKIKETLTRLLQRRGKEAKIWGLENGISPLSNFFSPFFPAIIFLSPLPSLAFLKELALSYFLPLEILGEILPPPREEYENHS